MQNYSYNVLVHRKVQFVVSGDIKDYDLYLSNYYRNNFGQ